MNTLAVTDTRVAIDLRPKHHSDESGNLQPAQIVYARKQIEKGQPQEYVAVFNVNRTTHHRALPT